MTVSSQEGMPMASVEFDNVMKSYGHVLAIRNLNRTIDAPLFDPPLVRAMR